VKRKLHHEEELFSFLVTPNAKRKRMHDDREVPLLAASDEAEDEGNGEASWRRLGSALARFVAFCGILAAIWYFGGVWHLMQDWVLDQDEALGSSSAKIVVPSLVFSAGSAAGVAWDGIRGRSIWRTEDGGSEYVWCATKAKVAASFSCAVLGVGCAVLAVWMPPQLSWRSKSFDPQGTAFAAGGLAVAMFMVYFGFFVKGSAVILGIIYLNFWELIFSFSVGAMQDSVYPVPKILGVNIVYPFASLLFFELLITSLTMQFSKSFRAVHFMVGLTSVGWIWLRSVILMFEIRYSMNLLRLVPLMNLVAIVFLISELHLAISCFWHARASMLSSAQEGKSDLAPEDGANLLRKYTFWWVMPTLRFARDHAKLSVENLPLLPHEDLPWTLFDRFRDQWLRVYETEFSGVYFIFLTAMKVQKRLCTSSLAHGWTFMLMMLLDPILLNLLLKETETESENQTSTLVSRVFLVLLLSFFMFIRVTTMEVCYFESLRATNNIRSMVVAAVFRKALRSSDLSKYDTGSLTNLMATDADKLGQFSWMIFFLSQWTFALLTMPVVIYCIYGLVGNAVWIGMMFVPIAGLVSRALGNLQKPIVRKVQELRDRRSQLMKELLACISVIKLQVWEDEWRERILAARREELEQIFVMRVYQALNVFFSSLLNILIPVSVFAWYTLIQGKQLDSATAFTTLAWIGQVSWSVGVLPGIFDMYAALSPSGDRLVDFLKGDSGNRGATFWLEDEDSSLVDDEARLIKGGNAVELLGTLGFRHRSDKEPPKVVLSNINLAVEEGHLVVIAGAVGAGKSTLLAGLSKALEPLEGRCRVRGRRAYVSQRPFLLNDTIENNILFGRAKDEVFYRRCVSDAALQDDLKVMQKGDQTVVGENGVQLSGGQKARLALARALYSAADVYFFDDVLSAVDAATGKFMWRNTICRRLKSAKKTIVLVTHQVQYLSRAEVDSVVILRDGHIFLSGPWLDIKDRVQEDITRFTMEHANRKASESNDTEGAEADQMIPDASLSPSNINVSLEECEERFRELLYAQTGNMIDPRLIESICASLRGEDPTGDAERKREGLISWNDFRLYLKKFGSNATLSVLALVLLLGAFMSIFMNVWLSIWSDAKDQNIMYLVCYAVVGLAIAILSASELLILTVCSLIASRAIHTLMFTAFLGASMSFFDTTPTGHIMNRFLQDLAKVDLEVPRSVVNQVTKTISMLSQIGIILLFAPWVIFSMPLIMIPYVFIFNTVRCAARDTRRLEAMAHSPVFTQFSDVLRGKLTIRAFAVESLFEAWNRDLIRFMAQGKYSNEAVSKWAQILTTQNACVLYMMCGLICVLLVTSGNMTVGQFGLVMLYSSALQRASMDYMMGLTSLEAQFVSVERVAEFSRTPGEEKLLVRIDGTDETSWPSVGHIELRNVSMRYAMHLPMVLRGLTLDIMPASKVALCGRTGCGKSSTFGVLSRLYPICGGEIIIDGVDISNIPLSKLRRAIRVITQDSVLFSGTLRSNLHTPGATDEDIWAALEKAQMADEIRSLPGELDSEVQDGGKNFSAGQRQLLCTARALMNKSNRVLLCDEATANVDLATDSKLHDVLLQQLPHTTVIMICHRLQHLPRFDRIVLIDKGLVAEQGSFDDLIRAKGNVQRLLEEAGLQT